MQTFIFMMNIEFQQCPYLIEKALDKNLHQDANRKHETIPVVVLFNRVITIQISSYKMKNGHKMAKKTQTCNISTNLPGDNPCAIS